VSIDEVLKEIRLQMNITQEQFARELNVSFSTLNRWENGHTTPSRLAKMRILEFCNKQNVRADIVSKLEKL